MQVTPFNFNNNEIRTIAKDGEPWFVAKDVATVLGYSNPQKAVRDHCKKSSTLEQLTGVNETFTLDLQTKLIPESDVYRLTMRSKLDGAIEFQDWVVEEVLPSIRKTGSYSVKPMSQTEMMIAQLQGQLKIEQEQARLAEEQEVIKERLDNMDGDTGYMTVLAYCRKNDLSCSKSEANSMGRKAGTACRSLGVKTGKVPDERWGEVNSYPIGILDKVAEAMGL